MASITLEDLHVFHAIDRQIFSRLIINCMRNPAESLLVMATWLWLEDKGYPNIILKMVALSDSIVKSLADEAVLCLNCLDLKAPVLASSTGGIPLTARIMDRDISLQMFQQNRFAAISGIKYFLNHVCAKSFTDILVRIVLKNTNSQVVLNQPLVIPGFPHPIFGPVNIVPKPIEYVVPTEGLWGWNSFDDVTEDDRTMFLTFSRGFPVSEDEVRDLFNGVLGGEYEGVDCVQMQENVASAEQPLYARMILQSVACVDKILNGRPIAKYRINGKHIWARKYERRD